MKKIRCSECGKEITIDDIGNGSKKRNSILYFMIGLIIGFLICFVFVKYVILGNAPTYTEETYNKMVSERDLYKSKYEELHEIVKNGSASDSSENKEVQEEKVEENISEKEIVESDLEDEINMEYDNCTVRYLDYEVLENAVDEKCIAIYYEFTNNSDENKTFMISFNDKAYQNGIELDSSIFHVNEESKNSSREIQPGTTVTVVSGFVLSDMSEVTLEIEPEFSYNKKEKQVQKFNLE